MKIFIAFSFSQLLNSETNCLEKSTVDLLSRIREDLINSGHDVFLAHYREMWGKELMGPMECTPKDYEEMLKTDLVIAFPGNPISGGVHIELGWASSHKKTILLFLQENEKYSPLIEGLNTITATDTYIYKHLDYDTIHRLLSKVTINGQKIV